MALKHTEKYYQELAEKWLTGTITPEEEEVFSTWYRQDQDKPLEVPTSIAQNEREHYDRILQNIKNRLGTPHSRHPGKIIRYVIAASVSLVLLSVAAYYTLTFSEQSVVRAVPIDIEPGGNNATLTLSDGSVITLNDIEEGKIVDQKGIEITKAADGLLTYKVVSDKKSEKSPQFNTIATPKGGQYQIILPDGTKVWLNAASSLHYPTFFYGDERKVELTGEGYFEVAKNKERPFKVTTANQEVIVLGTHFNVNAYLDEPMTKTTLLEGAVRIHLTASFSNDKTELILKPGEQSTLTGNNEVSVIPVDTAKVIAWKSGIFSFRGSDIETVIRELSRWYNVDVELEGELPDIKLWGEMDRNVTASEALEMLRYFNLNYKILQVGEVKKIIIS